jgi:hypothetical protein
LLINCLAAASLSLVVNTGITAVPLPKLMFGSSAFPAWWRTELE